MNQTETSEPSLESRIAEFIASNKLRRGDALPALRTLAQHIGVPFNALRDALHRAQSLGMVQIRPRSRVVVGDNRYQPRLAGLDQTLKFDLSQQDLAPVHIFHARAVIETETVRKAGMRRLPEDLLELKRILEEMRHTQEDRQRFIFADEAFHLTIARIAGNPALHTLLSALLRALRPDRLADLHPDPEKMVRSMDSHEALYRAMLESDPEKAGQLVAEHYQCHVRDLLTFSKGEAAVSV